jgi:hypothetical protein
MSNPDDSLFKVPESEYGDSYKADYLSMYQDYVASADRISERRHTANSFFLTANAALLGITGYLAGNGAELMWAAALAGILFSFTWKRLILSYRSLNTAKFKVIHMLEKKLPFAAYDEEWVQLKQGKFSNVHTPFSQIETGMPVAFLILHSVVFVINLWLWIGVGA